MTREQRTKPISSKTFFPFSAIVFSNQKPAAKIIAFHRFDLYQFVSGPVARSTIAQPLFWIFISIYRNIHFRPSHSIETDRARERETKEYIFRHKTHKKDIISAFALRSPVGGFVHDVRACSQAYTCRQCSLVQYMFMVQCSQSSEQKPSSTSAFSDENGNDSIVFDAHFILQLQQYAVDHFVRVTYLMRYNNGPIYGFNFPASSFDRQIEQWKPKVKSFSHFVAPRLPKSGQRKLFVFILLLGFVFRIDNDVIFQLACAVSLRNTFWSSLSLTHVRCSSSSVFQFHFSENFLFASPFFSYYIQSDNLSFGQWRKFKRRRHWMKIENGFFGLAAHMLSGLPQKNRTELTKEQILNEFPFHFCWLFHIPHTHSADDSINHRRIIIILHSRFSSICTNSSKHSRFNSLLLPSVALFLLDEQRTICTNTQKSQ